MTPAHPKSSSGRGWQGSTFRRQAARKPSARLTNFAAPASGGRLNASVDSRRTRRRQNGRVRGETINHYDRTARAPGHSRRVALATFAGTAMEWYDYYLFGLAASLVFNRLYFTELHAVAATLAAFATFGVGFVARPFGAALFGRIGDRIGRKPALILTVTLIGLATGLIGLLPDFSSIGVAAPVLLVLLRLTQGIAVGGEWSGAVTLAFEHAPPERRGWYASLPQLGSPVGALLSSGAFALVLHLHPAQFDDWGWRLPFLAAFPLLGVAFISGAPWTNRQCSYPAAPIRNLTRPHWRSSRRFQDGCCSQWARP